jgi:hypothetical protein
LIKFKPKKAEMGIEMGKCLFLAQKLIIKKALKPLIHKGFRVF